MDRNIIIIVLIVILIILYANNMFETYSSGSYDITPSITTNMDWNGATLSKYPYYTNNLVNPSVDVSMKINSLQKYQPNTDGPTDTTYIATGMNVTNNINNPDGREGFSVMNPYVPN
jgi:hypothetical protein